MESLFIVRPHYRPRESAGFVALRITSWQSATRQTIPIVHPSCRLAEEISIFRHHVLFPASKLQYVLHFISVELFPLIHCSSSNAFVRHLPNLLWTLKTMTR